MFTSGKMHQQVLVRQGGPQTIAQNLACTSRSLQSHVGRSLQPQRAARHGSATCRVAMRDGLDDIVRAEDGESQEPVIDESEVEPYEPEVLGPLISPALGFTDEEFEEVSNQPVVSPLVICMNGTQPIRGPGQIVLLS